MPPSDTEQTTGFDAPDSGADALGRKPFAAQIYSLIKQTPRDWTVRIGVYGPWGSGKSTVLGYVKALASADKHVIVEFNPWGYPTRDAMFAAFLNKVQAASAATGVSIPVLDRAKAKVAIWANKLSIADKLVATLDEAAGQVVTEARQAVIKHASAQLRPPSGLPQDMRVLVLVDDLDRTDPTTVPALLWAVRELFISPGFAFVMAIDPARLAEIISNQQGVEDGAAFLEKIIDFPKPLPTPTSSALVRLARADLMRWCPRLAEAVLDAGQEHLPPSPRTLRMLTRQLITTRDVLDRYDDELDTTSFLLAAILQIRWPKLANALGRLQEESLVAIARADAGFPPHDEQADVSVLSGVDQIITSNVPSEDLAAASALVRRLAGRLVLYARMSLRQLLDLEACPPVLTRREAGEFMKLQTRNELLRAAEEHASRVNASPEDVRQALRDRAAEAHRLAMDSAIYAEDEAGLRSGVSKATDAVEVMRCMLVGDAADNLSTDDVSVVLTLALSWPQFQNHEEYRELRLRERKLLEDLLAHGSYDAFAIHGLLLDRIESPLWAHADVPQLKDWLATLLEVTKSRVEQAFVALLRRPEGMEQITLGMKSSLDAYLMDVPADASVTDQFLEQLQQLAAAAKVERETHLNLLRLFLALAQALRRRGSRANPKHVGMFCQPAVLDAVWAGAVAARLNPRFVGTLRDERDVVKAAVPAVVLQTPPWWERAIAELSDATHEANPSTDAS